MLRLYVHCLSCQLCYRVSYFRLCQLSQTRDSPVHFLRPDAQLAYLFIYLFITCDYILVKTELLVRQFGMV